MTPAPASVSAWPMWPGGRWPGACTDADQPRFARRGLTGTPSTRPALATKARTVSTTTNTPAGPSECAAQAQQRHPAGEAGPYPPEVAAQYRAVRDRRAALTAAVRGILAEQPTPRLVRTVAHRIANDVHLIAEDIVRAMESEDRT